MERYHVYYHRSLSATPYRITCRPLSLRDARRIADKMEYAGTVVNVATGETVYTNDKPTRASQFDDYLCPECKTRPAVRGGLCMDCLGR